ncbi:hypothetical protein AAA448_06065 [Staphylococcus equorum]
MWLFIIIAFLTIFLIGFISENGKLKGQVEAREYEKKVLENRLKQIEK